MDPKAIIDELLRNKSVFKDLLTDVSEVEYTWSQKSDKWSLLEIVCHLYDEEREDFRTRVQCVLKDPNIPPPPFDPIIWVTERNYKDQNYNDILRKFLSERDKSVLWLQSLENPSWDNTYQHPKLGPMSTFLFLTNWLAHDYLHIRQIIRLKFDYLKATSKENLNYAGIW